MKIKPQSSLVLASLIRSGIIHIFLARVYREFLEKGLHGFRLFVNQRFNRRISFSILSFVLPEMVTCVR